MNITSFTEKLSRIPIIINNNKESLLCVDGDITLCTPSDIVKKIDDCYKTYSKKNIVIVCPDRKCYGRFPKISIKENFWDLDFNKHLSEKYDFAKQVFLPQSQIKSKIAEDCTGLDIVLLIIVDGLSYLDCLEWENVIPCLVDTVTITDCGYRNIVGGRIDLAQLLFYKGYRNFLGFSYWDKEEKNELTNIIFKSFSTVQKIQMFDEIKKEIDRPKLKKSFIQIVMQGLDGIAHKNRDIPLIEPLTAKIYNSVCDLAYFLSKKNLRGRVYVTSDHGILWKHKNNLLTVPSESAHNHYHARYYPTKLPTKEGRRFSIFGHNYTSLYYPYILRQLRSNEWGVHGGISLQESIVPFAYLDIN